MEFGIGKRNISLSAQKNEIASRTRKRNRFMHRKTSLHHEITFAPKQKINLSLHRKTTKGNFLGISLRYGTKKRIGAISYKIANLYCYLLCIFPS